MTDHQPPDGPLEEGAATPFDAVETSSPTSKTEQPDVAVPADLPPKAPFLRLEVERLSSGRAIGSLVGVVASGAILGFIPELNIAVKGILLGLMALSALRIWKRWRFPTVLEVSDGRFRWRLLGTWSSTAAKNISGMDLRGGVLRLRFVDAAAVEGPVPSAAMMKSAQETGFHLAIPGGSTTLSQVRQIQADLGTPLQDRDERGESLAAFLGEVRRATPRLWVTHLVIAVNVVVFLLMLRVDGSAARLGGSIASNGFPPEMMLDWGANYGPRTLAGEPWRLLTCMFLHFNILHIALNMVAVWVIGRTVERILGNAAYLTTYLFAGFCGSLASLWGHENAVCVGASGAVFGVMGAMLGIVLRQRHNFPSEILRGLRSQSVSLLIINLLLGSQIKGVDMAAHLGGAVGGLLCGLAIDSKILAGGTRRSPWQLPRLVAGCIGLAALAVVTLPEPREVIADVIQEVFQLEGRLVQRLTREETRFTSGEVDAESFESTVRDKVLPEWDAERIRIEGLSRVASADKGARDDLVKFMRLRGESWNLLTRGAIDGDPAVQGRGLFKLDEAFAALQDLSDRDGERLGMKLSLPEITIGPEAAIARLAAAESEVSRQLNQLFERHNRQEFSGQQFAEAIENGLVPVLEKEEAAASGVTEEAHGPVKSALLRSIRIIADELDALHRLARGLRKGEVPAPDEDIERLRRLGTSVEQGTACHRRSERPVIVRRGEAVPA